MAASGRTTVFPALLSTQGAKVAKPLVGRRIWVWFGGHGRDLLPKKHFHVLIQRHATGLGQKKKALLDFRWQRSVTVIEASYC